ncbi:hypothetical protein [Prauserella endophytica]|uniref:Uncharacterized protein n=1 Tax=Prauserella endophytica TaxID=1592324 RepID=A0ABY2RSS9_9PSEU|nr:hypothetical protein [Prauserella endophytica]TKG58887.1 hypothetical protein FCN18_37360 [Prauserella endophytica]
MEAGRSCAAYRASTATATATEAVPLLLSGEVQAMRVTIPYDHNPADLRHIHLAITTSTQPSKDGWKPALRDTIDGRRVVWAEFPASGRTVNVWVRDSNGDRRVTQMTV